MAKLSSLADLATLLPDTNVSNTYLSSAEHSQSPTMPPSIKLGYDGKPQAIRIATEKRKNKIVTVLTGFQSNPAELETIVGELKKQCGSGGRVLDNAIELQGDHREKPTAYLRRRGFTVK